MDGQPPLFYWLESVSLKLVSNKHIALRLPSILAMVSSMILLFVYLKKRNGDRIAFLCASFLLLTSFFRVFATNGRPYSLVMLCLVLTLIFYRNAQSPTWTLLFGISLVVAEALHYYAVFGFIPFGLAEAYRLFRTGKFRWGIWFAMAFGTLPMILGWPLLANLKRYFGSNIWSHFGLSTVAQTYGIYLGTDTGYGSCDSGRFICDGTCVCVFCQSGESLQSWNCARATPLKGSLYWDSWLAAYRLRR